MCGHDGSSIIIKNKPLLQSASLSFVHSIAFCPLYIPIFFFSPVQALDDISEWVCTLQVEVVSVGVMGMLIRPHPPPLLQPHLAEVALQESKLTFALAKITQ